MSTKVLENKELEAYYQALFEMYGSRGWQMLMEDVAQMHKVHDSVSAIATAEQLHFRRGELGQMEWLLSHRTVAEATYNALLSKQEGGDDEPGTGGVAKVVG